MNKDTRRTPRLSFRLAAIRAERRLSLKDLSEKTGLKRSTLCDLETGRHSMPSDTSLVALCDALCVTPGELFAVENKAAIEK